MSTEQKRLLEEQLIYTIKELHKLGVLKTSILKTCSDALPVLTKFESRKQACVRDINIVIDVIFGMSRDQIIEKHGIKRSTYNNCFNKGVKDINRQLAHRVREHLSKAEVNSGLSRDRKVEWIGYASEALAIIEKGKIKLG